MHFKGKPFPGSAYLLALTADIKGLKNICTCGKRAAMNIRPDERVRRIKEDEEYGQACGRCYS